MKIKMRKVKSWLRWAKKRYKEKYNIKVKKMTFSKEILLIVQKYNQWLATTGKRIKKGNKNGIIRRKRCFGNFQSE